VIRYQNNKRVVLQHIGSAHTEEALSDLMILAEEWIKIILNNGLFSPMKTQTSYYISIIAPLWVSNTIFSKSRSVQYRKKIKLDELPALLNDLVTIRIFEPASKLRSLELMELVAIH